MTFEEYAEMHGVEPECDSCTHYSVTFGCGLERQGIECECMSEFVSDGR